MKNWRFFEKLCVGWCKGTVNNLLINKINLALEELTAEFFKLREKYSDDIVFKSQVKWYEEGEKSNMYFRSNEEP